MGIEIITISFFTGLILWRSYRNFQSRNQKITDGYVEINLSGVAIDRGKLIIACSLIFALYFNHNKWINEIAPRVLLVIIIAYFLYLFSEIVLQSLIKNDRLAYGESNIILYASDKFKITTDSIQSISLNGLNNKITINSDKMMNRISFKRSRMSTKELENLFEFIDKEKGLRNIKISDNLRKQ